MDLVDNSIVFYITPSAGVTIVIEVATTPEEFGNVVAMPIVALAESYATSAGLSATSATASALTATTQAGLLLHRQVFLLLRLLEALGSATIASNKATDASNSAITSLAQAGIATVKAAEATADVVLTNADVVLTHADVVLTHADVVLTHADATTSTTQADIATTQAGLSTASATEAEHWANYTTDVAVPEGAGEFSAKHYATKAAASASSLLVDAVPTDGSTNAVSSNGVFDALAGKQNTLTFDTVPTNGSTNPVESNGIFDAIATISSSPSGVRQTVQSASVDTTGYANFLATSANLTMPISATTVNLVIHASGGAISNDRIGIVLTDTSLLLPASLTNFIFATVSSLGAITFSSVTLAPIYQFGVHHQLQPISTPLTLVK